MGSATFTGLRRTIPVLDRRVLDGGDTDPVLPCPFKDLGEPRLDAIVGLNDELLAYACSPEHRPIIVDRPGGRKIAGQRGNGAGRMERDWHIPNARRTSLSGEPQSVVIRPERAAAGTTRVQ